MKTPPQTLSNEESEKLITELSRYKDTVASLHKSKRNKLIGLLLLRAGLRVGELTKLKIQDLVYDHSPVKTLLIPKSITKGKTERSIPLGPETQCAIQQCQIHNWPESPDLHSSSAFTTHHDLGRISTRQVENIIKIAGFQALGKDIHPHTLRHTFASRLMRITNIRVVQQLLGHRNIQTTQIYTHPNQEDLVDAINGISDGPAEKTQKTL